MHKPFGIGWQMISGTTAGVMTQDRLCGITWKPEMRGWTYEYDVREPEAALRALMPGLVAGSHVQVLLADCSQETAERLTPYLDVAKALGSLIGQLDPVDVRELRVTCTGEAGELGVTPIARAALAGFLQQHLEEPVNPISAPYEAQARGIRLAEVKEPSDRYATTVRVTVTGEKGIHTATGTPGRRGEPRLVGLEGYEIDAVMEGSILIMRNQDRPGVIGSVGTLLGSQGVNVSRMQVGLDEKGGQALALWNVDTNVGTEALDALRGLDHVSSVHTLRL